MRNARLSRENRDSRIIDTFQRVKKENSPSVGSITSDWPEISKAILAVTVCVCSLMRNLISRGEKKNNIYSNYKQ